MLERLLAQFPASQRKHLVRLSQIWTNEVELIVKRMFEVCAEKGPLRLPVEVRDEAILELMKFIMWLEERVVATKTASVSIDHIDPVAEEDSVNPVRAAFPLGLLTLEMPRRTSGASGADPRRRSRRVRPARSARG